MKNINYLLLWSFTLVFSGIVTGQNSLTVNQKQTKPKTGHQFTKQVKSYTSLEQKKAGIITKLKSPKDIYMGGITKGKDAEINWEYTDPVGVAIDAKISSNTGEILGAFDLNNERIALFGDNSTPLWESPVISEWDFPIDMTPDGQHLVYGANDEIKVYDHNSPTPIWVFSFTGISEGITISPDGEQIFTAIEDFNGFLGTTVNCYNIGNEIPVWSVEFLGGCDGMIMSKDGATLVMHRYISDESGMKVIDANNGDVLFSSPYVNQNTPAISNDGGIIVWGDYDAYLYVYEYNENQNTYTEKWTYHVDSGGNSAWVISVAVSGDGNTIAAGSLIFLSNDYDGQLVVFNTGSPTPLWSLENVGDEFSDIDMSFDGSLIAATNWGPVDNSKPDLYLFRKNSNIPYFTYNTVGSMYAVDLTEDGMGCTFSGKLAHARIMGSGGLLHSANSNPGGGSLSGIIDLLNNDDNSGVKVSIPELVDYFSHSNADGNYTMPFIPEGVYTVEASKVGYYPLTFENINIAEDEITELNFEMEITGNPPTGLMASKGAGLTVDLNWEAPDSKDYEGFIIYRKKYQDDEFPETPLATVPADQFIYQDETALPSITYFYAVTADLGDNVQTPYSNTDEGWVSTGFITNEISVYEGSAPTIDGVIEEGEWDDAFVVDCSDFAGVYDNNPNPVGSVMGYYKMNAAATELYVAYINMNDTELEDHDEVALYIDDNNDGVFPPSGTDTEGNFWAAHYASGDVIKFRPIYETGGVGTVIYLDDPQIAVSIDAGYVVYEFIIPMGDEHGWQLNPGDDNKSSAGIFVLDDPSSFDGWWPYYNTDLFSPPGFGTLVYNAIDEIPPPPESLTAEIIGDHYIVLNWDLASINDFDHYNIYSNLTGNFNLIDNTIGNQFFYELPSSGSYQFYITTVDFSGQESGPSQIIDISFYTGAKGLESKSMVNVSPNPFGTEVTFSLFNDNKSKASLQIFNINGEMVFEVFSGNMDPGEQNFNWNGTNESGKQLPDGIYFYILQKDEKASIGKIIKTMH